MPRSAAPEDALAALLDVDLQEALGLALLDRPRNARHRALADQRLDARLLDLRLAHADAPERRIGVEGVGGDAVGPLAPGVAQQVVGDDLVVVVAGVGEGALAVAVAERPDARVRGAQRLVDLDVAALVGGDAGGVEPEVVGVGDAADGEEEVRAARSGLAFLAVEAERDALAVLLAR